MAILPLLALVQIGAEQPAPQQPQPASAEQAQTADAERSASDISTSQPAQEGANQSPPPVPAARQASNVAIITIKGGIDAVTAASVQRRLERAEQGGADAVVIEIDSPGGEVFSVIEIASAIKNSPIANTVAWVNPDAYSGGAIIALACREIVVAPAAQFGDAAPISISPISGGSLRKLTEKDPELRAKIFGPVLGDVVDSARRNGYDEKLAQGFLMTGVELWLIEHTPTGKRYFVDRREFRSLFGADPPDIPATFSDPGAPPPTQTREQQPTSGAGGDQDDRFDVDFTPAVPLDRETIEHVKTKLETPSGRPIFALEDADEYTLIEHVSDGTTLLILSTQDMLRLGLATQIIRNDQELKQYFGASNLRRLDRTWSESLVRVLSTWPVRGLLIVVFLLALYMEMAAPGIGLAGGVAVAALAGLAAPALLVGAASWWSVAAVVGGIALIFAEILVIPGFGIAGVGGAVLILGGLVGLIAGEGALFPDSPRESQDLLYGLATLLLALVTASVGIYFISKRIGTLPVLSKLVLAASSPSSEQDASGGSGMLAAMGAAHAGPVRVGDEGLVISALRPAGRAEFNGELLDVVSEMGFVDEGAPVRVVEAGRFRIVVEPVHPNDAKTDAQERQA